MTEKTEEKKMELNKQKKIEQEDRQKAGECRRQLENEA